MSCIRRPASTRPLRCAPSQPESIITDPLKRIRRLRWTAFALGAMAFVLAFFHRLAPGALAGDLQRAFGVSGASLGLLAAMYFYVYFAMQVPSGILADTLGPRKLFTGGALVAGAGSLLFGLAPDLGLALLGRFLVGLGVSVVFISVLKLNAAWFFERQFATMSGLLMFTGNMGGLLAAAPLAWVVAQTSWRYVFVATGAMSIVLAGITWMLLRDNPRELGLPSMQQLEGKPDYPRSNSDWRRALKTVLANRRTWPVFLAFFGQVGSQVTWGGLWAIPYLHEVYGMSRQLAAWHTSMMILGLALAALVVGVLSDRSGRRTPLMRIFGLIYVLCWLPLLWGGAMPVAASLALFALMGVSIAGTTLVWACGKEVNPPAFSGTSTAVVNTGGFFGPALLQPVVGFVLDYSGGGATHGLDDWRRSLAVLFAFALCGWLCTFMITETHCRNIYREDSDAGADAMTPGREAGKAG